MFDAKLPWHAPQWSVLAHALQINQFPHALLLHGPVGVGKEHFLAQLASALVCSAPVINEQRIQGCGTCSACQQFSDTGEHADILQLRVAEGDREIKIDRARAAIEFAGLRAHYGGRKLILIHEAEKLTRSAANAMLKTLEEPPEATVVILSSAQPARLMSTIRSRCQQLRFSLPTQTQAKQWLREQGIENPEEALVEAAGSPLTALQYSVEGKDKWRQARDKELRLFIMERRSPSRLAQHWLQYEASEIHGWLYDRLRRLSWENKGVESQLLQHPGLKELAHSLNLQDTDSMLATVNEFGRLEVNNINKQLCLESILIDLEKRSQRNAH